MISQQYTIAEPTDVIELEAGLGHSAGSSRHTTSTSWRAARFAVVSLVALAALNALHVRAADALAGMSRVAADNCGAHGQQPHLRSGGSWALTAEERAGLTIEDDRFLTMNHHADLLRYRFEGLYADARYVLRIYCFNVVHERHQRLSVDGHILHGATGLPLGQAMVKTVPLPQAVTRDGRISLRFEKTGGNGVMVSALELWSDRSKLRGKPGNYLRFRIDTLPADGRGMRIAASMKIHRSPWHTPVHVFPATDRKTHTKTGATPWYRLQNIPKAPGYGQGNASLLLNLPSTAQGATEFALYPDAAAIIRSIDWNEPDGKQLSLAMDFSAVRTFRDHARQNYQMALGKTGSRIYPLTRAPLLLSNAWGYATGDAEDYMLKTLRLLGFNSVVTHGNVAKFERLYGWSSQAGQYGPPIYYPYDEATARVMYEQHFKKYFAQKKLSSRMAVYQLADEPVEQPLKYPKPMAKGFSNWLAAEGLDADHFQAESLDDVAIFEASPKTAMERRRFYWTRKYRSYLTPKAFALAAEAIRTQGPSASVRPYVALSGHSLYMKNRMPLDMFQLAQYSQLTPGISDWMTFGSWRWDSHQAVAFSVAPFIAGARRYGDEFGQQPRSFPMMHCVMPSLFRAYTQLANQCKLISYYNFGPSYAVSEGHWSDSGWSQYVVQHINNRATRVDDILGPGVMRPSRVAMLYAMSTEYWWPKSSFADKRATFLALSHEYYQPELVTEEQVAAGALAHYDAIYVLDSHVARAAQERIMDFVDDGGLLWACSEALVRDEYGEQFDVLKERADLHRTYGARPKRVQVSAVGTGNAFTAHSAPGAGRPNTIQWPGARVRAQYADGLPAWLERGVGDGHVVFVGHRCGLSYSQKASRPKGKEVVWSKVGRSLITQPLHDRSVHRDLILSQPGIMASALSTANGTVVILYPMGTGWAENLTITLSEAQAPVSVQRFNDDNELEDIPHTFADGRLKVTLKKLPWHGQILVARRTAAPADDRLEAMRLRTIAGLESDDWQTLSAAAWFAGFFPDWELAGAVAPLLGHQHWSVRRAAVETIGRIGNETHAATIIERLTTEKDDHVLADSILTLHALQPATSAATIKHYNDHLSPVVQAAVRRIRGAVPAPRE